jgi:large subunit ribosomal protein L10
MLGESMAKSKKMKEAMLDEVTSSISNAESIVFAEYRGIDVLGITQLRANSRTSGVKLKVFKNTLFKKAIKGTQFEILNDYLKGPLIYGISDDSVAPAKLLVDFSKDNESIVVKGGALQGSLLDVNAVNALAKIPPREELLSQFLGVAQAPIVNFVQTLNEIPSRLVRVLAAVRDKKDS